MKKRGKNDFDHLPDDVDLDSVIDLTPFLETDLMETDVLGSYTGTPLFDEFPEQDADDL